MIKEVIVFTVVCDNCGKDSSDGCEHLGWDDENYALDCAMNADFIENNHSHYCPDCASYDDDDNFIIKQISPIV